jgi:hypothetical protein
VSTEVASTRLPREILREIDREANARGLPRSVYLAHLIELGTARDSSAQQGDDFAGLRATFTSELRELRDSQRNLAETLRAIQASLQSQPATVRPASDPSVQSLIDRLLFSTFFSEALIKRISASLYRNPGELAQVVREARDQATADASRWRERIAATETQERGLP